MEKNVLATSVLVLLCLLCVTADGKAVQYTYEVIDPDSHVTYGPFLTNDGAVVWGGRATIDTERRNGIFQWQDGEISQVVDFAGRFSTLFALTVSDNGRIAFSAGSAAPPPGISAYRVDDDVLTPIIRPDSAPIDTWVVDINRDGNVAYTYRDDFNPTFPAELRLWTADKDLILATAPSFFGAAANNNGVAAYMTIQLQVTEKLFVATEQGSELLLDTPGSDRVGKPAINDDNIIAFLGRIDGVRGVFSYVEGETRPLIVNPAWTFFGDLPPRLNNLGQSLVSTTAGLTTGPTIDDVVFPRGTSDFLVEGIRLSTSNGFGFGRDINDHGQVVANLVRVKQNGGPLPGEVLVIATPIPEPSTLALFIGAIGFLTVRRLRR